MPLDDIAADILGKPLRFIARLLFEGVVELLLQGTGRLLLRLFRPRSEPGDTACALTGLAFWLAVVAAALWLARTSTH